MENNNAKKLIGEIFNEIADGISTGSFGPKVKIGLTVLGSEHGIDEMISAAKLAKDKYKDFDIVLIGGNKIPDFEVIEATTPEEGHHKMIELLESGYINGCVTQHFDFPIGVSTVGKVVTPGKGKEMIIATTTGTTSTNRIEGMLLNTISGISVAKALGINEPKIGILNIEGARKVENLLKELKENGYNIEFAKSGRADGGAVMRGNDLLAGTPDVMICDSLTGNLLIKMFSSFTTGGYYETLGAGYGPGIGEDYNYLVNIVSRASGAPLICEALRYCATCAQNKVLEKANLEFKNAKNAKLDEIIAKGTAEKKIESKEIKMPPKKVVTEAIAGIDILELDDACKVLWSNSIYSESGMGCTGPVVLVAKEDIDNAIKILTSEGYK
ncbi:glycine/sarcosine/betaine reductase complex component C subunit alpha [Eubacterium multiforme]|uniref:Glycine reductase n=1 Tax=Eubacterium multiforme TaxID=83339 RepID=A0ABT9UPS8_9FIRM|nr:glycine/sarcosine/betaine reductase complex component C subunit alpha [Eubacterium multiforme]MDQ0148659.1 hypothetical protein [Eubacterium multiforme]